MTNRAVTIEPVSDALHPRVLGDLFLPSVSNGWGVLVLHGSSGRPDAHSARLLADVGATVLAQRWFGQPGLPAEIRDVPLELFREGVDLLESKGCSRIAVLGRSRGAEAALLLAVNDKRVNAVFALSPSAVAWAGTGLDNGPAWTFGEEAIPYVSYDHSWWNQPRQGLIEYREYHERSLRMDPQATARAHIPVERSQARIVLVAGGADALWPSNTFAQSIAQRLCDHGRACELLLHPEAGHRVLLPGELTPRSQLHAHGGTDFADAELGRIAWEAIVECMRTAA